MEKNNSSTEEDYGQTVIKKRRFKHFVEEGTGFFLSALLGAALFGGGVLVYLRVFVKTEILESQTQEDLSRVLRDAQEVLKSIRSHEEKALSFRDDIAGHESVISENKKRIMGQSRESETLRSNIDDFHRLAEEGLGTITTIRTNVGNLKVNAKSDAEIIKNLRTEMEQHRIELEKSKAVLIAAQDIERNVDAAINNPQFKDEIIDRINRKPTHPIGTILPWAGSFDRPEWKELELSGWRKCNGDSIPKDGHDDLWYLIGNSFNNNESSSATHFKLPDLQGKTMIGSGLGETYNWNDTFSGKQLLTVLSPRKLGKSIGEEGHKLTIGEMPDHNHENGAYSQLTKIDGKYTVVTTDDGQTPNLEASLPIQPRGGNKPHNNMQPSLVVNFIIKAK